jgi:hypothetical protein
MITYVTQNTLKGLAFDLVTDYLDSYSGKTHFSSNLEKINKNNKTALIESSVEEIMSTISNSLIRQIPFNKKDFLKDEIYRELNNVYEKEKQTAILNK